VWGEDLEITLRLHRAGVRVVYGSMARVHAECPHTVAGLWKQRVRWLRSYIKVLRLHRDMVGNPHYGLFGPFLLFNGVNMVLVPLLQLVGLVLLPFALWHESLRLAGFEWIAYLGIGFLFAAASLAMLLDRSPRDLLYLPYGLLLLVFSHFYNAVVLYSVWAETRAHAEHWNKLERRDLSRLSRASRWPAVAGLLALVVAVAFVGGYWLGERRPAEPLAVYTPLPQASSMAVAIHFDAWRNWRDAYESLLAIPEARYVNRVAVSAGRADWTYFRWPGTNMVGPVQRADTDMLEARSASLWHAASALPPSSTCSPAAGWSATRSAPRSTSTVNAAARWCVPRCWPRATTAGTCWPRPKRWPHTPAPTAWRSPSCSTTGTVTTIVVWRHSAAPPVAMTGRAPRAAASITSIRRSALGARAKWPRSWSGRRGVHARQAAR
jgi:hypothetical protein